LGFVGGERSIRRHPHVTRQHETRQNKTRNIRNETVRIHSNSRLLFVYFFF